MLLKNIIWLKFPFLQNTSAFAVDLVYAQAQQCNTLKPNENKTAGLSEQSLCLASMG